MKDHGYYSGSVVNIFTRRVQHAAYYVSEYDPLMKHQRVIYCWFRY